MTQTVILLLALLGAQACSGRAPEDDGGDGIVVKDRPVKGDLVTAGRTVRIQAGVDGDVAVAGERITLAGPIQGYVLTAGRSVTLDAPVADDLWAAGETVDVRSRIGEALWAAGRVVHLGPGAVVLGDAHLAGNSVTVEGLLHRDLTIGARRARIGADVGGNIDVRAGHVVVLPGSVIDGNLVVRAPEPPEISPQATVVGRVRHIDVDPGSAWRTWLWLWLAWFAGLLVVGTAAVALSPRWTEGIAGTLAARTGRSALIGLLVFLFTPVLAVLLMMTLIGVPLAMTLLGAYVVVLVLSSVVVAYQLGAWLLPRIQRSEPSRWSRLLVGALIVSLAMCLPVIGWIVALAVLIVGTGAIVLERREFLRRLRGAGLA